MTATILADPFLGKIVTPTEFTRALSLPGRATQRPQPAQFGLYVAVQRRKRNPLDPLSLWEIVWNSIVHNERVDAGAAKQAGQLHGGGSTPAAPDATNYFRHIALANAALTIAKGDQSLGSTSSGVTTNEFTTIGLSRATADTPVGGNYTAPSSLGSQFAQAIIKTFTASGSGTVHGAGLFDRAVAASSILYGEANFGSTAVMVSGDQLTVTITNNN